MNSPKVYIPNNSQGFTLVEVAVVMAIFGFLVAMGLFFDFSLYRGSSFHSDVDIFASVLQRARSRAINNINESRHGVFIDSDKYVLFQGSSYGLEPGFDQPISRNGGLVFGGPSEIIFDQLSGDSNFEGDIIISGNGKTATVTMNNEGLINR